jgi:hypothetical protein
MLRRFVAISSSRSGAPSAESCSPLLRCALLSYHHFAGAPGPNSGGVPKSNPYVNTQTSAAPIKTACDRTFDPMLFQEVIQATTDPQWSAAIQRYLREDGEYMNMMLREGGGGGMAIDQLITRGLGGSDEEAMQNLKRLLQTDRKAALTVCAIQDAYQKIRENRDLQQTKLAAEGGAMGRGGGGVGGATQALKGGRAPFGAGTSGGGGGP